MKPVQISVSPELRDEIIKAKGKATYTSFLAQLMTLFEQLDGNILDRLLAAKGGVLSLGGFIEHLLDSHDEAGRFADEAMEADVDLDEPTISFLGEEITKRLNEARGDQRITDFVGGMLDFRQEYLSSVQTATAVIDNASSKAWERPLGMVTEADAVAAVIAGMKDLDVAARCNRVGPVFAEGVARDLLGLERLDAVKKPATGVFDDGEDDWAVQDEADEERAAEQDAELPYGPADEERAAEQDAHFRDALKRGTEEEPL